MTNEDDDWDPEADAAALLAGKAIIGSVKEMRELAVQCGLDELAEQISKMPDDVFAVVDGRECKGFLLPVDETGRVKLR